MKYVINTNVNNIIESITFYDNKKIIFKHIPKEELRYRSNEMRNTPTNMRNMVGDYTEKGYINKLYNKLNDKI